MSCPLRAESHWLLRPRPSSSLPSTRPLSRATCVEVHGKPASLRARRRGSWSLPLGTAEVARSADRRSHGACACARQKLKLARGALVVAQQPETGATPHGARGRRRLRRHAVVRSRAARHGRRRASLASLLAHHMRPVVISLNTRLMLIFHFYHEARALTCPASLSLAQVIDDAKPENDETIPKRRAGDGPALSLRGLCARTHACRASKLSRLCNLAYAYPISLCASLRLGMWPLLRVRAPCRVSRAISAVPVNFGRIGTHLHFGSIPDVPGRPIIL